MVSPLNGQHLGAVQRGRYLGTEMQLVLPFFMIFFLNCPLEKETLWDHAISHF